MQPVQHREAPLRLRDVGRRPIDVVANRRTHRGAVKHLLADAGCGHRRREPNGSAAGGNDAGRYGEGEQRNAGKHRDRSNKRL